MPPKSRAAQPKKHALTLAQLASYDDILTDALVDHAYYWTTIPKNRPSYLPSRGVKEEEIAQIIQTHLAVNPDLDVAEEKLLATNGLAKFYRALKTDNEKEDFRRHMRRYMQIYLPDCPFEVASTNRYTIFQQEASISARRFIKSHETIKYLSGIQVVITPEEEAQLSERKKDFSIVISSRKKEINLFMGPARFANHDCDANARLVTTGQSGIEIIATKPIGVGDEITVTYGDSYFGDDNCECLCKTCEDNLVNGWAPEEGTAPVKQSVESDASSSIRGYSFRRRGENATRGHSETPSLTPIARPKVRRTRMKASERTGESTPSMEGERSTHETDAESSRPGQKRKADSLATPPGTPAKRLKMTAASPSASSRESSATDMPLSESAATELSIVVASPYAEESDHAEAQIPTPEASQPPADSESETCAPIATKMEAGQSPTESHSPSMPESQSADEKINAATVHEEASALEDNEESAKSGLSKHRVPGDYTLTPLLLSEPETAWVFCTVCSKAFVQRDAYYTRMSCPRCERHSKIYGYLWPKTEPEGKWDKEERILDHRLVHRFLDPEDEAMARGRKLPASQAETSEEEKARKKRLSGTWTAEVGTGSGIWRKLKYMAPKEDKAKQARQARQAKQAKQAKEAKEAKEASQVKQAKPAKQTKQAKQTRLSKSTMAARVTKAAKPATAKAMEAEAVQQAPNVEMTETTETTETSETIKTTETTATVKEEHLSAV